MRLCINAGRVSVRAERPQGFGKDLRCRSSERVEYTFSSDITSAYFGVEFFAIEELRAVRLLDQRVCEAVDRL